MADPESNATTLTQSSAVRKSNENAGVKRTVSFKEWCLSGGRTGCALNGTSGSGEDEQGSEAIFLRAFKAHSFGLGLVVGFFIQLSSLGANFLLSTMYSKDDSLDAARDDIVILSVVWSFVTSAIGVMILMCMRGLVMSTLSSFSADNKVWKTTHEQLVMHLECHFAIGALIGVCLAWTCTDVVLGYKVHMYHSLLTLGAGLIWCKVISFCGPEDDQPKEFSSSDDEIQDDISKPLLTVDVMQPESMENSDAEQLYRECKMISLAVGLFVGFFGLFCSMGGNLLLTSLCGGGGEAKTISREFVIQFSLVWSFLVGAMSVIALLLLRSIVLMSLSKSPPTIQAREKTSESIAVKIECFFGTGALLGVNCAWLLSDSLLGLKVHMWPFLLSLFMAGCWYKVIAAGATPANSDKTREDESNV